MEDETEIESEYFQDPEVDREWLEGDLAELQHEGRVQQQVTAAQINQMLLIQAKTGYGSVFDLISDHFPSLVTTYGRENLNGGFITEVDGAPDEMDLGYGPLSASELHFDCDGIDQNSFRFYSNKDSEDKFVIHVIHKESGKRDSVSGRNLENIMKLSAARAIGLHWEYCLDKTRNILRAALERKKAIDYWDHFCVQPPVPIPASPQLLEYPAKPEFNDPEPAPPTYLEYPPEPTPDSFSGSNFENAFSVWSHDVKQVETENQRRYDESVAAITNWNSRRVEYEQLTATWPETVTKVEAENQRRKAERLAIVEQWKNEQTTKQQAVADLKRGYRRLKPEAVKSYCKLVLQSSDLPNGLGRKCDFEYIPESKILIVDHALPNPDDIVYVKNVDYVQASGKLFRTRLNLADGEFKRFYDDVLYQICLRTFHELFEADWVGALDAVVFNGWIESVDRATANDTKVCVMSVQIEKKEFQKVNLAKVDPQTCFKALNGISSSMLHSLTPIAPILKIKSENRRNDASYEVAGQEKCVPQEHERIIFPKGARFTLTPKQCENSTGKELLDLLIEIECDGIVTEHGARRLNGWLESNASSDILAIPFLVDATRNALRYGALATDEALELQNAIERVLPKDIREPIIKKRQLIEGNLPAGKIQIAYIREQGGIPNPRMTIAEAQKLQDHLCNNLPTDRQLEYIHRLGATLPPNMNFDDAILFIDQLLHSKAATEKQINFIRELGGNPPAGISQADASKLIDKLLVEQREKQARENLPTPRQTMVLRFWNRTDLMQTSQWEVAQWLDQFDGEDHRRKAAWELFKKENHDDGSQHDPSWVPIGAGEEILKQMWLKRIQE